MSTIKCKTCKGKGRVKEGKIIKFCDDCDGLGEIVNHEENLANWAGKRFTLGMPGF